LDVAGQSIGGGISNVLYGVFAGRTGRLMVGCPLG
jgi:hypothetical protein